MAARLTDRQFQSTLPLRGATRLRHVYGRGEIISIHAPLAGSDVGAPWRRTHAADFNPRSPCGERPNPAPTRACYGSDFNPRSPCGERQVHYRFRPGLYRFQSTLPLRGATGYSRRLDSSARIFQSTLPLRGATLVSDLCCYYLKISIHAPLAGSDGILASRCVSFQISIHAPLAGSDLFLCPGKPHRAAISIHAPLAGSDTYSKIAGISKPIFQSTLPLRGATFCTDALTST